MAKIPFTLKEHLAHPEWKVETVLKEPVTIVKTDLRCEDGNILCYYFDGKEEIAYVTTGSDLFIITPEPELTEFEKVIKDLVLAIDEGELRELGVFEEENLGAWAVKKATELLNLAREQFIKDGYVIEKKLFHDAVEKIDDKHKADISVEYSLHCKVENGTRHAVMNWNEFQEVAQHFIDCGKAEALKDLPRWRTWKNGACGNSEGIPIAIVKKYCGGYVLTDVLCGDTQYIMLSDLEKLPKED